MAGWSGAILDRSFGSMLYGESSALMDWLELI